jgi:hypothetical protein
MESCIKKPRSNPRSRADDLKRENVFSSSRSSSSSASPAAIKGSLASQEESMGIASKTSFRGDMIARRMFFFNCEVVSARVSVVQQVWVYFSDTGQKSN